MRSSHGVHTKRKKSDASKNGKKKEAPKRRGSKSKKAKKSKEDTGVAVVDPLARPANFPKDPGSGYRFFRKALEKGEVEVALPDNVSSENSTDGNRERNKFFVQYYKDMDSEQKQKFEDASKAGRAKYAEKMQAFRKKHAAYFAHVEKRAEEDTVGDTPGDPMDTSAD